MSGTQFSKMQTLKRRLFAMRNGVVADTLRKAGCPHRIIFGLNLPQLNEIAAEYGEDRQLSEALRTDTALRESALLAPMIYPRADLTIESAREMAAGVLWHEDADILCFKLLRHAPFAAKLAAELCEKNDDRMARYTGLRLFFTIISQHAAEASSAAERELMRPDAISTLASMLREEAGFLLGDN